MIVSIHCLILIYSLAPVSGVNSVLQQGPLASSPLPLHEGKKVGPAILVAKPDCL